MIVLARSSLGDPVSQALGFIFQLAQAELILGGLLGVDLMAGRRSAARAWGADVRLGRCPVAYAVALESGRDGQAIARAAPAFVLRWHH